MSELGLTRDRARGKWRGILMTLGIDGKHLKNKHGPCPVCHGKDRFRYDDDAGSGSWICSHCGAGDGFDLASLYLGKPFREVAAEVDAVLAGNAIKVDPSKPKISDADRKEALNRLWRATAPMVPGDLADTYLASRGLSQPVYSADLRCGERVADGEGGLRPVMVAMVRDPAGNPATMHRTFLRPDGKGKAEMDSARKMMPGAIPEGSCIRLMEWIPGGPLGIAEGIETAFAASDDFHLPVWSAINATMLARWKWPEGCEEIAIFGDADDNFVGHAAVFELAKRASMKGLAVTVHIPGVNINQSFVGLDWADIRGRG
jgi:putative DNA primase/helicase